MQLGQHLFLVEDRDDYREERHTIPSDTPAGSEAAALDQLRLPAHRQLEPAVERPGRQVQVGLAVAVGAEALERAHHGHRGQHRAVEVARHDGFPAVRETRSRRQLAGVATVMVPRRVVLAPEPRVGRHRDDQRRARRRHAAQLGQGGAVVGQVLDHVGGGRSRTAGRSGRPRRAGARSAPRARRGGRGAGRTRSPRGTGRRPRRAPAPGNPSGCGRCRSRRRGCAEPSAAARGGSAPR